MNDTRQLRSTWMEYLKQFLSDGHPKPPTPQQFRETFEQCLKDVVVGSFDDLEPLLRSDCREEARERLRVRYDHIIADPRRLATRLRDHYGNIYRQWRTLSDERRQHNWSATRDYIKIFISRTAQAVMIAAVVLGASYCAMRLGIPLPYFRIAP